MEALLGLIVVVVFVAIALGSLPKGYRCSECNYYAASREEAAGHQTIHAMHRTNF